MKHKRRHLVLICVLLCLCLLLPGAAAEAGPAWLVYLERGTAEDLTPLPYADGYYLADSIEQALPYLRRGAARVFPADAALELMDAAQPNDPAISDQWYLFALGASAAWSQGLTGSGVRVAVIDSGVNALHEDLAGSAISGRNLLGPAESRDETAFADDLGHGTLICGILAAQKDNGLGGAGLCPEAELLVLRCFSGVGGSANSGSGSAQTVISAIGYAMEQGADVINLSFGGTTATLRSLEPILQQAADRGILLVASAGNNGGTALYYPAAFECVTGVGWTAESGEISPDSQHNASIYAAAPGTNIYGPGHLQPDAYRSDSGGSFAAPMVTALAAMAKQTDPEIGTEGFRLLLRQCAEDLGAPGRDDYYGCGSVRADAFAAALLSPQPILYETNGGALRYGGYDESYRIGQGAEAALPNAFEITRPGFRFTGWYADPACTAPVRQIPGGSVGPVTLYAGWAAEDPAWQHGPEAPCPGAAYCDMPAVGSWSHAAIDWAIMRGITLGTDASHVSPDAACTRAEAVTFLFRAAQPDSLPPDELAEGFADVPADRYFFRPVAWAAARHVTEGVSRTSFAPDRPCTRAQIVTFLYRACGSPEADDVPAHFSDVPAAAYYAPAVAWAQENGITNGVDRTHFSPAAPCTRAQIVTFLYRTLTRNP